MDYEKLEYLCREEKEREDPCLFCNSCEKYFFSSQATVHDEGIGENEFWGSVSIHRDLYYTCPYCDSDDIFILG